MTIYLPKGPYFSKCYLLTVCVCMHVMKNNIVQSALSFHLYLSSGDPNSGHHQAGMASTLPAMSPVFILNAMTPGIRPQQQFWRNSCIQLLAHPLHFYYYRHVLLLCRGTCVEVRDQTVEVGSLL